MKEVRDGDDSQDTSETEEESGKEGSTNLESPEEIGRLEEVESLPDFLQLGARS